MWKELPDTVFTFGSNRCDIRNSIVESIANTAITNKIIAINSNIKLISAATIVGNLVKLTAYLEILDLR